MTQSDGVQCCLWLWKLCLVSESSCFLSILSCTWHLTIRSARWELKWGRNEEEQLLHCELDASEAGRHSNRDLPDKWTYSKWNLLRTLPKAKKMRLHNERRLSVIRCLHVIFNGFNCWMWQWKKHWKRETAEGLGILCERAVEPHLSIFLWDLHCNPWSSAKPPSSPHGCVHTVECTGRWILLSSQGDNGCVDAGMHACTHTMYFSPFTQWVLVTRVGDMDRGRHG